MNTFFVFSKEKSAWIVAVFDDLGNVHTAEYCHKNTFLERSQICRKD